MPEDGEVLFDAAKVDLVALAPDGGTVEIIVVADAPWTGSDAQLVSLQGKIHTYVGFAVDGQLAATYPEVEGLPWRIVVRCHDGAPDSRTAELLSQTAEVIPSYGGELRVDT